MSGLERWMATLFKLPMLGQTMQEGTILKWYKAEGEKLEGWETLLEVMTDKVNMEVDPQVSGVLRKILAPEGATVPVGAPVAIIGTADEPIDQLLAEAGAVPAAVEGAAGQAVGSNGGQSGAGAHAEPSTASSPRAPLPSSEPFPSVSPRAREAAAAGGLD